MKNRQHRRSKHKSSGCKREGYVYILSNPSMPNLVKIGYTTRDIDQRIFELSSATGVPEYFKLEYKYFSTSPNSLERQIHQCLSSYRGSENREFFSCSPSEAVELIRVKIDIIPDGYVIDKPPIAIQHSDDYKEKFYNSIYSKNQKIEKTSTVSKESPTSENENWVIKCSHCSYNNIQNCRPELHKKYHCNRCQRLIF